MNSYRFSHFIQVRHDDIDPFHHVNNARFVTYLGLARLAYFERLGVWDGASYPQLGFVVVDLHISFQRSIMPGQMVRVGVRATSIGNKSLKLDQQIDDEKSGDVFATAQVVLASYDHDAGISVPLSDYRRDVISSFEGLE